MIAVDKGAHKVSEAAKGHCQENGLLDRRGSA